jgi:hypothetical protein
MVVLGAQAADKLDAIRQAGETLVKAGCVELHMSTGCWLVSGSCQHILAAVLRFLTVSSHFEGNAK